MNVLGIETSCDETAAAVVKNGRLILSNVVASSLREHKKFGGIIPEVASRRQIEYIYRVVRKSLETSHLDLKKVDAVAVTSSPGLLGSLLVGISFAKSLAFALKKPLIEVDHIKAHLYANFLTEKNNQKHPSLPAIGLVVSGGHSSLYRVEDVRHYELLGQTRDDAAGEAFDKVARILNLGYPGGPAIDRLAKTGHTEKIRFTCADMPDSADFSFSGIKTAVLYFVRDKWDKKQFKINHIAYAFQSSVVKVLVSKCLSVCRKTKIKTLLIGGGVAANSMLRERLAHSAQPLGIKVYFPPMTLCLDNAAMIAGLGHHTVRPK